MAIPEIPVKAKLFIGVLTNSDDLMYEAERNLGRKYGEIDYRTTNIPFNHTEYYKSMGSKLFKVLLSFKKLVKRDKIAEIKLYTNNVEKIISGRNQRRINIDPGYLTLSNVYLASCKEYFHRVYLKKGIYLENELKYVSKRYVPWEWTYPDYVKPEYLDFFYNIRNIYHNQIRKND